MNSVVGFGGEVIAWSAQAEKKPGDAAALLRSAADDEGGIEKLPVTPGPTVPPLKA